MMAADATKVVKVVVGTTNAAKKEAVSRVVDRIFPNSTHELIAIAVTSGVSDQPFSLAETVPTAAAHLSPAAELLVSLLFSTLLPLLPLLP